jgi:tetratricopeptide (TPR) repeat protein
MKDKSKKKKTVGDSLKKPLSPLKKRIFWGLTLSTPLLSVFLLQIGLRVFNYGGNLELFMTGPEGYEQFLRCNPNVARRYFYMQSTLPTPPKQLFLQQKPPNGYRIFVLGESSSAGFPYGNNVSFPNVLERSLSNAFPEKRIEVINVAMAAINSYTLLDLVDDILKQSPDALLIYTGHNEYYGALGVGSVLSLGSSRWLIHTYLRLQSIKVFLLLRDVVGWLRIQFNNIFYRGSELDPSATLMEGIVAEQTIPYGSPLYEAGKRQFEENIDAILHKAAENGVPVVLSELVSNVRDQEPFISVEDREGHSAKSFYSLARRLEATGEFEEARQNYIKAKDFDALRFRAPEEFNVIIRELAKKYSFPLVPTGSYFNNESPNGIIGSTLMLEHLHPNKEGYFLLAKAFYETMQTTRMISDSWPPSCIEQERNQGVTELDSVYCALVIRRLKGGWPFKPKSLPNRFIENFRPANHIEEIAFRALQGGDFSLESAHMELGKYYEKQGEFDKAFSEYNALVTSIPSEMEFYQKAAMVLLRQKEYDKASQLLRKSLKYKENDFANKWIGQIALMKNEYKEAILFLKKADSGDAQVIFNLSRAFYFDNQWNRGEEYYLRLQKFAPRSEYAVHLTKLRALIQLKRSTVKPHR